MYIYIYIHIYIYIYIYIFASSRSLYSNVKQPDVFASYTCFCLKSFFLFLSVLYNLFVLCLVSYHFKEQSALKQKPAASKL